MKMVTIEMPEYAVRYLRAMCERERSHLSRKINGLTIGTIASFDALGAIECSLGRGNPGTANDPQMSEMR